MNERNLRYFRKTLSAQLEDLIAREKQTVEGLQETELRVSDSVDQATKEAGINFRLRIQSREVRLMGKIREALERIEEGTFGICALCGEEIALKRLKARPVTTYCIKCKSRLEARERVIESGGGRLLAFTHAR